MKIVLQLNNKGSLFSSELKEHLFCVVYFIPGIIFHEYLKKEHLYLT